MWSFFTEGDTKVFNWQLALSQKSRCFPSPPHGGVRFFRQTNFDLEDKCVKLRIPAGIG
jgi:hypothetical protein